MRFRGGTTKAAHWRPYATFLGGLLGATTGEGRAQFAIVISAFYIAMFFGTARVLANVDRRRLGHSTGLAANSTPGQAP